MSINTKFSQVSPGGERIPLTDRENNTDNDASNSNAPVKKGGVEEFITRNNVVTCSLVTLIVLIVLLGIIIALIQVFWIRWVDLPITFISPCDGVIANQCNGGRQFVDGSCALPCPDGFNHSAVCTCTRGLTLVGCDAFGKDQGVATTCPVTREFFGSTCVLACPSGWKRTASCTCQFGEVVTDCAKYGVGGIIPRRCPIDREYVDGMCYKRCAPGTTRSAGCSCQSGQPISDCAAFGVSTVPSICPAGRDFYASECLDPCPFGSDRTGACSCKSGEITTDCTAFGFAQSFQCDVSTQQAVAGICYQACPYGGVRTAICTCDFNDNPLEAGIPPVTTCPIAFPLPSGISDCLNYCGTRTNAALTGGSTVSPSPGCPDPSYPSFSTSSQCFQFVCPAGGARAGQWSCTYPGSEVTINGDAGCDATHPLGPFGTCPGLGTCFCYAYSGALTFVGYAPFNGGNAIVPVSICPSDHPDQVGGVCFQFFCPVNIMGEIGTRTAALTCFWSCEPAQVTSNPTCNGPNGTHPIFTAGLCYKADGITTSCESLNGGTGTIPTSCPVGLDPLSGGCYRSCPPGQCRSGLCTCSDRLDTIDCSLFGNPQPIGSALGPICSTAQDLWGGLCYSGPCAEGYDRIGSCSCSNFKVVTNCTLYGDPKGVGDVNGPQCELGFEYFGGLCYQETCASVGMSRTGACSCSNLQVITNCTTFGDGKPVGDPLGPGCNVNADYFGGICYIQKCPEGVPRTGACSCSNFETKTDCTAFGDNKYAGDPSGQGPGCRPDADYVAGLCYNPQCPAGRTRTAACSCQKIT